LKLGACSLLLAASRDPEAWRFNPLAVDRDPGAKLRPAVAHDLERSRDGLQLWP